MGCLVYLVIIAALAYFGSSTAHAYVDYYRLKDAMKQEATFSRQRSDSDIQSRVSIFADSLGLPRSAGNVRITRGKQRVTISSSYSQTVQVPLVGPHKLRFTPKVEASF